MTESVRAAIVGHGYQLQRREDSKPRSGLQMIASAVADALAEADVSKHDIGALYTPRGGAADRVFQYNMKILNELKIAPALTTEVTSHGAGALSMLFHAALAVSSGYVDYALCVAGDNGRKGATNPAGNAAIEADPYFELPLGPSTPALYAQVASRYMHEYGAKREDFARAAVVQREWSLSHPYAAMRSKGPITVQDVLDSAPIATPLHLLDCASFYGGASASAFVITRDDLVAESHQPVYIRGFGESSTHEFVTDRMGLDLPTSSQQPLRRSLADTGAISAGERAYHMAGLGPGEVDMLQSSIPFSFALLLVLEAFKFCDRGQAPRFIAGGGIDLDGGLPVNTNGGMLSFGQTGAGCVGDTLSEGVLQLRGRALGRQVEAPKVAMIHGHGGILGCHSAMLLGTSR